MKPSDLLQYAVSGLIIGLILLLLGTQLIGQPAIVFVETGSMAPTLEPNDGYLAVPMLFAGEVEVGDVILFESQEIGGGELTTHRVTDVTDEGYITKGDANPFTDQSADEPPVSDGQVRSVAMQVGGDMVVIPGLGASVGVIRDGMRLFQNTVLAPLGFDAGATSISTGALLAGLLLFVYGAVTGATDRYARSRSRGGAFDNAVLVIAVLVLIVILPVNFSMLLPSGVYQYEILSSESPNANPQVIGVGQSSDVTYAMRNSGFIPTVVFLEPASDGVTVKEDQIYVPIRSTVETSITMQAPDRPGSYFRFVREYRYLVVLPPSLIAALHAIHPVVAIVAINLVVGGVIGGISVATVGTGRLRLRSRNRELELGDEIRRRMPSVLLGIGGSKSKPKPPAPPTADAKSGPKPSASETRKPAASGPPPKAAATGFSGPASEQPGQTDTETATEPTTAVSGPDSDNEPRDALTDSELIEVHDMLSEPPEAAGLDREAWTLPLLQRVLFERYEVDYPREECKQLLQRADHEPDEDHVPTDEASTPADESPRDGLTETERADVEETVAEPPEEAGLDAAVWTLPLLQRYLFETYGVDYPRDQCIQLLQRAGHDPEARQPTAGDAGAETAAESDADSAGEFGGFVPARPVDDAPSEVDRESVDDGTADPSDDAAAAADARLASRFAAEFIAAIPIDEEIPDVLGTGDSATVDRTDDGNADRTPDSGDNADDSDDAKPATTDDVGPVTTADTGPTTTADSEPDHGGDTQEGDDSGATDWDSDGGDTAWDASDDWDDDGDSGGDSGGWSGNHGLTDAQFMDVFTTLQAPPEAADIDADRWTPAAVGTYLADAHGLDYTGAECEALLREIDDDVWDE